MVLKDLITCRPSLLKTEYAHILGSITDVKYAKIGSMGAAVGMTPSDAGRMNSYTCPNCQENNYSKIALQDHHFPILKQLLTELKVCLGLKIKPRDSVISS